MCVCVCVCGGMEYYSLLFWFNGCNIVLVQRLFETVFKSKLSRLPERERERQTDRQTDRGEVGVKIYMIGERKMTKYPIPHLLQNP